MKVIFTKRMNALFPANQDARKLLDAMPDNGLCKVEYDEEGRTNAQNSALHLYFEQVAQALNEAGYDCNNFFKEGYTVPFSKYIVKDTMWKPIQKALTDNSQTSKAKKPEYSQVYDVLNNKLAEYGIHVPFPSKEFLIDKVRDEKTN